MTNKNEHKDKILLIGKKKVKMHFYLYLYKSIQNKKTNFPFAHKLIKRHKSA